MALEQQRDDIARTEDVARCNKQLDDSWWHLRDAMDAMDCTMRDCSDQVQRTLISTAYDLTRENMALIELLMVLRGVERSER